MKMTEDLYDAVVVSDEVDPNFSGGVRAKILGFTDSYADEDQPMVYPDLTNGQQSVPLKGYRLKVHFADGDINLGRYTSVSQSTTYLPPEYTANYPHVGVTNLGTDGYYRTYNRKTGVTTTVNPNGCTVTWDAAGTFLVESSSAYGNAGAGAANSAGTKNHAVLTEATIDIFTCRPVGNGVSAGGLLQGSEYLSVSQVSQASVDAFHGSVTAQKTEDQGVAAVDAASDIVTVPLLDASGATVDSVEFYESPKYVRGADGKKARALVVGISDGKSFPETAALVMKKGSGFSVHYLIGRIPGDPEVAADVQTVRNSGFAQFVNLSDDAYFARGSVLSSADKKPANSGTVSVMLIASEDTGSSMYGYTDYQYSILNEILTSLRHSTGEATPVKTSSNLTGAPLAQMPGFDASKLK